MRPDHFRVRSDVRHSSARAPSTGARALAAAAAALVAACVPLPGGHSLARRTVAGKQPENTLVAADGSTCRVRGDVYDSTHVGDERRCAWRDVAVDGSRRAVPSPRPEPRRLPGRPASR